MKVIFVPAKHDTILTESAKSRVLMILKNKTKIGIVYVIQFKETAEKVISFLKENKKEIFTEFGKKPTEKGQILGCDVVSAEKITDKAECFLFIGDGKFHPMEVWNKTKKPVFIFNPVENSVYELDYLTAEKYEKRRIISLEKARTADVLGILVSTKIGQSNLKTALELKEKIEKKGKKAFILVFDTFDKEQMLNFPEISAYINTSCPRMSEDFFEKPLVNIEEYKKILI